MIEGYGDRMYILPVFMMVIEIQGRHCQCVNVSIRVMGIKM